jgi:predicted transcriptional regulator
MLLAGSPLARRAQRYTTNTEKPMELHLPQQTEAKLNELARRTRRGTDELLEEAVEHLAAYHEWLERKVNDSLTAVERGQTVSDEEVHAWLERRERS